MANTGAPPNYYKILGISEAATTQQVRDAYKKAALKTHPDRVPADSPERATRTRKFQLVNDAYYTLSDTQRRREYDAHRNIFGASAGATYGDFADDDDPAEEVPPQAGAGAGAGPGNAQNAYSWAWNFFTGGKQDQNQEKREKADSQQFGDVFEEMLREEGMAEEGTNRPTGSFWSMMGGLSGGALGFIVGNMPGAFAGAVAGNRLGAVRDAKGKSVYAVFQELPQPDRARLLTQLAAKIFSHTVGA
ncbi:putative J domain-containing protein [Colletotrichum shisoi]|uniref:Putative J domain-containing protein n=1 Tax=Colletotrichum shisoi TaxID=2078593 RepID=A0A5Q4BBT7_9PEZI|nr:putative J domain-containing protein [Colletotrichum shisoi]